MQKTTVSLRNGKGQAKHNDRTAGIGDHVDRDSIKDNRYYFKGRWVDHMPYEDLRTYEISVYKELYSAWLEQRNIKYEKARKKDRIRSMEEIYSSTRYEPHEMILQIGNIDNPPDADKLMDISREFMDEIMRKYRKNIKLLDAVMHLDEATPHIHLRYTVCSNRNGLPMPAMDKGLEEAGFSHFSHKNDKPENSKYNNREIAFTDLLRDRFIQLVRQFMNIEIMQGLSSRIHADKGEYIRQRDAEFKAARETLNAEQLELEKQKNINITRENHLNEREKKIENLEIVQSLYNAAEEEVEIEYQRRRCRGHDR